MSEPSTRRILILFSDYGAGHRSAAEALKAALERKYGEQVQVDMVNPIDQKSAPEFLRKEQARYDERVTQNPRLYKFTYDLGDMSINTSLAENGLIVMLHDPINKLIKLFKPHAIINTSPLFNAPLSAVYTTSQIHVPTVTVVTDYTQVARIWFHQDIDLTAVPTQDAKKLGFERGLEKERVQITGIPVHPDLTESERSKAELRRELGWLPDLTTLLVVGSKRVRNLPDVLRAINHSGLPLQITLVAGGDDQLYKRFQEVEWHLPVQIYNKVDNIPTMMKAADLIVCKAGGLITSEALASGLPILYIDAIQGQETGNVDYVVGEGAGEFADNSLEALEIVFHWLQAGAEQLAERVTPGASVTRRRLSKSPSLPGRPQRGPQKTERTIFSVEQITDLLANFQLPWSTENSSR